MEYKAMIHISCLRTPHTLPIALQIRFDFALVKHIITSQIGLVSAFLSRINSIRVLLIHEFLFHRTDTQMHLRGSRSLFIVLQITTGILWCLFRIVYIDCKVL